MKSAVQKEDLKIRKNNFQQLQENLQKSPAVVLTDAAGNDL